MGHETERSSGIDRDEIDELLNVLDEDATAISKYASIESNIFEPVVLQRLMDAAHGDGSHVQRALYAPGTKQLAPYEEQLGALKFFSDRQVEWSNWFIEKLIQAGIDRAKVEIFVDAIANEWIDGKKRRQTAESMLAIKASIKNHDAFFHKEEAGKYVRNRDVGDAAPLFSEVEMAAIFEANSAMLEVCIGDYLEMYFGKREGSINTTYVRRGVYMTDAPASPMVEHNYLNSYSLAITLPEVFAQTYSPSNAGKGMPTIFSAPIPAIQSRVVAFAPFIRGMTLSQLEIVVAPPVEPFTLTSHGIHGEPIGIDEYSYG
ncbi:hypothetical protein WS87_29675 [Burkholderia sp. MSMB0856]|uniref:hypothetical protein n=1 Tax=Burkholderia TaxID=32008 RepID=UPI00075DD312|nr:hypothetical protein [Burkholderia sp. MSMB0856]AOJ90927.1 hypothetical protein WS87_29675 [Burkholderia sp. MSMB0856]KVH39216.1 hypothetical protein WS87_04475 [Burkholderia sp. MSMB0856]